MKLGVQYHEIRSEEIGQYPILADKGDVSAAGTAGTSFPASGSVVVDIGNGGIIGGSVGWSGNPSITYTCNF